MKRPRKPRRNGHKQQMTIIGKLDDMAVWEELKDKLLPRLREDLINGLTSDQILKKYESYATARLVHNVIADPDSGKSNTAAKEILDRIQGKPTEKKELTHKMARLSDVELDALIISKSSSLSSGDTGEPGEE
jgi:hypothetical protein